MANIGILTAMFVIDAKVYRNTKAIFTVGLMFFVGLLMLHNIIAVYAYSAMEPLYAIRLLPYFVGINIGLSVLEKSGGNLEISINTNLEVVFFNEFEGGY